MAGDWIKVEKATARKPEVLVIAAKLDIHPDHAFGMCFRFWSWCDDHLEKGNATGVTLELVDALVGRLGFASSLVSVGWLQVNDGSVEIPNFERHLSKTSKKRALTARRVSEHKSKSNASSVTKSLPSALPREDKKREDNNPLSLSGESFCEIVGRAIPTGLKQLVDGQMIPPQHLNAKCLEKLAEYVSWCGQQTGKPLDAITLRNRLKSSNVYDWSAERLVKSLEDTIGKLVTHRIYDCESKPPARTAVNNSQGLSLAEMVASLPAMEASE